MASFGPNSVPGRIFDGGAQQEALVTARVREYEQTHGPITGPSLFDFGASLPSIPNTGASSSQANPGQTNPDRGSSQEGQS